MKTSFPFPIFALIASLSATHPLRAQTPTTNGLSLWLRADVGTTTNATGNVTTWQDQSGNANHALQPEETMAPLLVPGALNSKPVLRFDGTDDFLDVATHPSLEIAGDISSFFVVKFDDFATFRAVWGKRSEEHTSEL